MKKLLQIATIAIIATIVMITSLATADEIVHTFETCDPCHFGDNYAISSTEDNVASGQFLMYQSPTIDGQIDTQPSSYSMICLSCHDGILSLGTDLSNDHPISITYSDFNLNYPPDQRLPLFNNKVECSTCHDVHGNGPFLLRISNGGSQMCLTCHNL